MHRSANSLIASRPSSTPQSGCIALRPADFCVIPEGSGFLVVVPDLVQGELRMVRLAR